MLYNRGVYNSMLIAEAIAEAQKITGKKVVTGEDVRRGLENLNIDDARLKAIGLDGFVSPVKTSCADHNSHSRDLRPAMGRREMGQGQRRDRTRFGQGQPLLDEAAKAYAEKNAGWPARTEPCDNK